MGAILQDVHINEPPVISYFQMPNYSAHQILITEKCTGREVLRGWKEMEIPCILFLNFDQRKVTI